MLLTCTFLSSSGLYQNFNVQSQLKIPVVFSRIWREDTALVGVRMWEAVFGRCLVVLSLYPVSQVVLTLAFAWHSKWQR